jgi:hypothetical protein
MAGTQAANRGGGFVDSGKAKFADNVASQNMRR